MNNRSSCSNISFPIVSVLGGRPQATADIRGSSDYPDISGIVRLYQTNSGVIVRADVSGLPYERSDCRDRIFAFHIHKGGDCSGDMSDPFSGAMSHYDPKDCDHPYHAGDMPPLFGNHGRALSIFLTDRFSVSEVIGRTIIIHDRPDDFVTQPSGNAGTKIACGVIRRSC